MYTHTGGSSVVSNLLSELRLERTECLAMKLNCSCLDIDDLLDVLDAVESLSGKWKMLSTKLGIKTSSIDVIEHNHPGDVKACLYDALVDWLKMNYDHQRHERPSWERLAKAVKSLDSGLFEQINMQHLH